MSKRWTSYDDPHRLNESWQNFITEGDKVDGWYGIVKECYEASLLEEGINDDLLVEGFWSKAKYYIGKLGSLEKGGKFFGSKKHHAKAKEKLSNALGNASNQVVSALRAKIEEEFPEFPNMESQEQFRDVLFNIGEVYDSLMAAVEKDPEAEGYIDCVSANAIIENLRLYVRHELDYELADAYKHFVQEQMHRQMYNEAEEDPEDLENVKGKFTRRGKSREETESEVIKGLESNLFPLLLALPGIAGIAGGLLTQTDWFREFVTKVGDPKTLTQTGVVDQKRIVQMQQVITPEPGEGISQISGRLLMGNPDAFGPDVPVSDMLSAMKSANPPVTPQDLAKLSGNPAEFMKAWGEHMKGVGPGSTMKDVFPDSFGADALAAAGKFAPDLKTAITTAKDLPDFSNLTNADAAAMLGKLNPNELAKLQDITKDITKGSRVAGRFTNIQTVVDAMTDPSAIRVHGAKSMWGNPQNATVGAALAILKGGAASAAPAVTGGDPRLHLLLNKTATKIITRTVWESVSKTISTTVAGKAGVSAGGAAAIAAGPIIATIGLGLVTAGAAVKLIRMKGLKSSRAQMFKDLLEEMGDVDCTDSPIPPPPPPRCIEPEVWDEEQQKCVPGDEPEDDCEKAIAQLMSDFKTGDLVRYVEERGTGNVTGMDPKGPDGQGFGGESLITKIIAMPGEGNNPSVDEQKETDEWKEEKVIFVQVQGMVPLEAGQRKAPNNKFRAGAIRDCKLNFQVPTEADYRSAWQGNAKGAQRMDLPRPEDIAGDMAGGEVVDVYFDTFKKNAKRLGVPDDIDRRNAWIALFRLAKEVGNPQSFHMRSKGAKETKVSDLREKVEPSKYIPVGRLWTRWKKALGIDPSTPEGLETLKKLTIAAMKGGKGAKKGAGALIGKKGRLLTPAKVSKIKVKKSSGAEEPLKESRRRKPCRNCKKQRIEESKQPDPWDATRSRWKDLAGIK